MYQGREEEEEGAGWTWTRPESRPLISQDLPKYCALIGPDPPQKAEKCSLILSLDLEAYGPIQTFADSNKMNPFVKR